MTDTLIVSCNVGGFILFYSYVDPYLTSWTVLNEHYSIAPHSSGFMDKTPEVGMMRPEDHPQYKALEEFFSFLEERKPQIFKPSLKEKIIMGLFNKVVSNTKAIMLLIKNGFLEESIILIRPVYEATLLLNYIHFDEGKITQFIDLSAAVTLRNLLYQRDAVTQQNQNFSWDDDVQSSILGYQNTLKQLRTFQHGEVSDTILNDPKKIKNKLIDSHKMPGIDVIKNYLKEKVKEKAPEIFSALDMLHVQLYFQPTERIHPNWNCLDEHHLYQGKASKFNFKKIMNSVACMLCMATYAPSELGMVPFPHGEATEYLLRVFNPAN